jgi:hypothetical protein
MPQLWLSWDFRTPASMSRPGIAERHVGDVEVVRLGHVAPPAVLCVGEPGEDAAFMAVRAVIFEHARKSPPERAFPSCV